MMTLAVLYSELDNDFDEFLEAWISYQRNPMLVPPTWFDYLDHMKNDADQKHPLHLLAAIGRVDWIKFLLNTLTPLQTVILLSQKDSEGKTPADYAKLNNHLQAEKLLKPFEKSDDEISIDEDDDTDSIDSLTSERMAQSSIEREKIYNILDAFIMADSQKGFETNWKVYLKQEEINPSISQFEYLSHKTKYGQDNYPLHLLALKGNIKWVAFVLNNLEPLEVKFVLNQKDGNGLTPIDACKNSKLKADLMQRLDTALNQLKSEGVESDICDSASDSNSNLNSNSSSRGSSPSGYKEASLSYYMTQIQPASTPSASKTASELKEDREKYQSSSFICN
jgi:hypothetical protein